MSEALHEEEMTPAGHDTKEDAVKARASAFDTISVIGLGYIGLPTAAIIASKGKKVIGIDINQVAVDTINQGKVHIVEPDLDIIVQNVVKSGFLKAQMKPAPADAFLIAVPTPITENKKSDLSYVLSAAKEIAAVLKLGDLIILESTSPVGSTERLVETLKSLRPDLRFPSRDSVEEPCDVNVAYCPERVLPGKVIEELVSNDRSIGGLTKACTQRAIALYEIFVEGELIGTDTRSAELCKLAENAFRDVNIAYANELANVCDHLEMNVWEVIGLANRHPRVNILQPGPGVGGHCIAVDPWFIAESAPNCTPVIQAARHVNDGRPGQVVAQVLEKCRLFTESKKPTIALLGLAFKPNIDDLRESPAVTVAQLLLDSDCANLIAVEPNISKLPKVLQADGLELLNLDIALNVSDIIVLLVDHNEFKQIDSSRLSKCIVIDTRGVLPL